MRERPPARHADRFWKRVPLNCQLRFFNTNREEIEGTGLSDRLIFAFGMIMTMVVAFGMTLMVREFRRSDRENKRRMARRALYAKPRVIDIDPKG